jgi:hypothetical protein
MATFTVDVFTTLDGFGSGPVAYWEKEGPELLAQRARSYGEKDQTLVFAPNTYRVLSCTRSVWVQCDTLCILEPKAR